MLRRSLRLTALSVLLRGDPPPPAPPRGAHDRATRVVLSDPTGDVWTISEGEDEEYTLAGDEPTADVVRAVVAHRRHSVKVKMRFADLRRKDPQGYVAVIVSRESFRGLFVNAGPEQWRGRHVLVNGRYGRVKCRRLSHDIDYAENRVVARIPRRCLERPSWVRVELTNYMFRGETEETFQELTDNPHTDEPESAMTPRLHRAR